MKSFCAFALLIVATSLPFAHADNRVLLQPLEIAGDLDTVLPYINGSTGKCVVTSGVKYRLQSLLAAGIKVTVIEIPQSTNTETSVSRTLYFSAGPAMIIVCQKD